MRKGRFDEIFFVDIPTYNERVEIFRLHLKKRLKDKEISQKVPVTDEVCQKLASLTEGFIGAEIEQVVVSALYEAFFEKRPLEFKDLVKTIKNTVPLSTTQREQILSLRAWANVRAVAATKKEDLTRYAQSGDTANEDSQKDVSKTRGGRALDF